MIKNSIKSVLRRFGYEIRRLRPQLTHVRLDAFFEVWKRLNPTPGFIIDVGANHGNWTRAALGHFPGADCLMIEPQERLKAHSADLLGRPKVRWLTAGVADQPGSMILSLPTRDDSASFTISPEQGRQLGFPQVEVPIVTLNEIVIREKRLPDILKIDAEGYDLKALRGASRLLGSTELFFVECAICGSSENSLEAVCSLMWQNGYRVFDVTDMNHGPKHGNLWMTEVAFVRNSAPIWGKIDTYE